MEPMIRFSLVPMAYSLSFVDPSFYSLKSSSETRKRGGGGRGGALSKNFLALKRIHNLVF